MNKDNKPEFVNTDDWELTPMHDEEYIPSRLHLELNVPVDVYVAGDLDKDDIHTIIYAVFQSIGELSGYMTKEDFCVAVTSKGLSPLDIESCIEDAIKTAKNKR